MIGYTEVLQTMGAMIIFALIITTSNRHMLGNIERKVNSEVEVHAVTLAQDIIEYSKQVPFDAATTGGAVPENIPDDFVSGSPIPTSTASKLENIQYFEQFNGFSRIVDTSLGTYTIRTDVSYMGPDFSNLDQPTGSKSIYKRIKVTVSNPSLAHDVVLSYTRTYINSD